MEQTYECPLHKIIHKGQPAPEFQATLQTYLLQASMRDAYTFYKRVKIGCECPENYKAFEAISRDDTCP